MLVLVIWITFWALSTAWGYMIAHAIPVGPLAAPIPQELLVDWEKRMNAFVDSHYKDMQGQWREVILSDSRHVQARYMGRLAKGQRLVGIQVGDAYAYGGNLWIWLDGRWVDP